MVELSSKKICASEIFNLYEVIFFVFVLPE